MFAQAQDGWSNQTIKVVFENSRSKTLLLRVREASPRRLYLRVSRDAEFRSGRRRGARDRCPFCWGWRRWPKCVRRRACTSRSSFALIVSAAAARSTTQNLVAIGRGGGNSRPRFVQIGVVIADGAYGSAAAAAEMTSAEATAGNRALAKRGQRPRS